MSSKQVEWGKEIKDGIEEEEKVKYIYIKWLNENPRFLNDELTEKKINDDYILYINRFEQQSFYVTHVFGKFNDNKFIKVFEACDVYNAYNEVNSMCPENKKAFTPLVLKHKINDDKKRYYICDMIGNCFYLYTKIYLHIGLTRETIYLDTERKFFFNIENKSDNMVLHELPANMELQEVKKNDKK